MYVYHTNLAAIAAGLNIPYFIMFSNQDVSDDKITSLLPVS